MKDYFAKKSWASYVMLGALLFAILALVYSAMSDTSGFLAGNDYAVGIVVDEEATHGPLLGTVITLDVIAMILALATFAVDGLFDSRIISIVVDVCRIAVGGCLIGAFAIMVDTRGTLMGFVWFSDLLSGDENAVAALNDALLSWIFYVIAIVCAAVSCSQALCLQKAQKAAAAA